MRIVLGGSIETGLIRYVDEVRDPSRNRTTHLYYMALNRRVSKLYFDRAATFVALATETVVPSIDWSMPPQANGPAELSSRDLGVSINDEAAYGGREWDDDSQTFAELLLDSDALSPASQARIGDFSFDDLDVAAKDAMRVREAEVRRTLARHYLCRLFLHLRAAPDATAVLVLGEDDIRLLSEIADFVAERRLPTPYPIPAISDRLVDADNFGAGLLNFAPPDALSLMAVKRDPLIARYAARIRPFLDRADQRVGQRELLKAMQETYERAEAGRRAERVFEITSWVIKPLHYVPVLGTVIGIAEDVRDVLRKWAARKTTGHEWHLIGARMTDIATRDFLARKGNLLG